MFAPPSVRSYSNPSDLIEPMVRYTLTLVSYEDTGVSMYEKDKAKPDAEHSILWKWNVDNDDGTPVLDGDEPWIMWEWTSNRTGYQRDGTAGKARARLQALIGRELTDDEMSRFLADITNLNKLPGRRAYATFEKAKVKNREGDEVVKAKIQSIMPFRGKQQPTPAATPVQQPEPEPAPPLMMSAAPLKGQAARDALELDNELAF